jgi:hypothetical protein
VPAVVGLAAIAMSDLGDDPDGDLEGYDGVTPKPSRCDCGGRPAEIGGAEHRLGCGDRAVTDDPVATLTALAATLRFCDQDGDEALAEHVDGVIARYELESVESRGRAWTVVREDVRELLAVAEELGVKP